MSSQTDLPFIVADPQPRELTVPGPELKDAIKRIEADGGRVVGAEVPSGCVSSWCLTIRWPQP